MLLVPLYWIEDRSTGFSGHADLRALGKSDRTDSRVRLTISITLIWAVQQPSEQPTPKGTIISDSNPTGLSINAAAGLAYLTIIPAIVFLIVVPFKSSSSVRFHAWQSIFFFVTWAVVDILAGAVQNLDPSCVFLTWTVLQFVGLAIFSCSGHRLCRRLQRKTHQAADPRWSGGEAG
jgi:uncharacterized membrane protein